jgi:hypothetical protein
MDARSIANLPNCVSINFRNTHNPTISSMTPLQSQMIDARKTSETSGTGERVDLVSLVYPVCSVSLVCLVERN